MSTEKNKFGLSRHIPAEIRRTVRQRDGFGCVVCGLALVDYEHFEPEFSEAQAHDADGICLLCPVHHRSKGALISLDTIKRSAAKPFAKRKGFSFGPLDPGIEHPEIRIGPLTAIGCETILELFGEKILWIDPPEEDGAPYRISAIVCDKQGVEILEIIENEWRTSGSNWDVRLVGAKLTLNDRKRKNSLKLLFLPGTGLEFAKLDVQHRDTRVTASGGQPLRIHSARDTLIRAEHVEVVGAKVALHVDRKIKFGIGARSMTGTGLIELEYPDAAFRAVAKATFHRQAVIRRSHFKARLFESSSVTAVLA